MKKEELELYLIDPKKFERALKDAEKNYRDFEKKVHECEHKYGADGVCIKCRLLRG